MVSAAAAAVAVAAAAEAGGGFETVGSNGVHRITARLQLDMHPGTLADVESGIHQQLDSRLLRHSEELDGVALQYSSLKILDKTAPVLKYFPMYRVNVKAKWLLFRPVIGAKLVGQVNAMGSDFISLLMFGYFPVAIRVEHLPRGFKCNPQTKVWSSRKDPTHQIREGDHVVFQLIGLEHSSWLQLVGSLKEPGTGSLVHVKRQSQPARAPAGGDTQKPEKHKKRKKDKHATPGTDAGGADAATASGAAAAPGGGAESAPRKVKGDKAKGDKANGTLDAAGPSSSAAAPVGRHHHDHPDTPAGSQPPQQQSAHEDGHLKKEKKKKKRDKGAAEGDGGVPGPPVGETSAGQKPAVLPASAPAKAPEHTAEPGGVANHVPKAKKQKVVLEAAPQPAPHPEPTAGPSTAHAHKGSLKTSKHHPPEPRPSSSADPTRRPSHESAAALTPPSEPSTTGEHGATRHHNTAQHGKPRDVANPVAASVRGNGPVGGAAVKTEEAAAGPVGAQASGKKESHKKRKLEAGGGADQGTDRHPPPNAGNVGVETKAEETRTDTRHAEGGHEPETSKKKKRKKTEGTVANVKA